MHRFERGELVMIFGGLWWKGLQREKRAGDDGFRSARDRIERICNQSLL